jgi:hypothetical protein
VSKTEWARAAERKTKGSPCVVTLGATLASIERASPVGFADAWRTYTFV